MINSRVLPALHIYVPDEAISTRGINLAADTKQNAPTNMCAVDIESHQLQNPAKGNLCDWRAYMLKNRQVYHTQ